MNVDQMTNEEVIPIIARHYTKGHVLLKIGDLTLPDGSTEEWWVTPEEYRRECEYEKQRLIYMHNPTSKNRKKFSKFKSHEAMRRF